MLPFLEKNIFCFLAFYHAGVHKIASPFSTREKKWCLNKNTFIFRQTWISGSLFWENRFPCHHTVSVYSNLQLGYLAMCAWSVVEWNMRLHLLYLLCKFSCKKSTKRQNDHDREIGISISKTPQLKKKQVQKKSVCTEF